MNMQSKAKNKCSELKRLIWWDFWDCIRCGHTWCWKKPPSDGVMISTLHSGTKTLLLLKRRGIRRIHAWEMSSLVKARRVFWSLTFLPVIGVIKLRWLALLGCWIGGSLLSRCRVSRKTRKNNKTSKTFVLFGSCSQQVNPGEVEWSLCSWFLRWK